MIQDGGLHNQGLNLEREEPFNLVSNGDQRKVTNEPNVAVSSSLSAPPERKNRECRLGCSGNEQEEVQDNDTTNQEVPEEEAQNACNLGKVVGLHARNEDEVIKALMKCKKGREVYAGQKSRGR